MKFRPVVTHALAAVTVLACAGLNGGAQAQRSGPALEIFSHLRNDTVIVSHSKNFNISSGALMQLLVGVSK
ncbi:MAG: hypothetical protein DMG12_14530 [Acidobacteria bacterium]|nr:MAG: hypothetical protein DMG12_14530 [Acidobacteriota bacterium]